MGVLSFATMLRAVHVSPVRSGKSIGAVHTGGSATNPILKN